MTVDRGALAGRALLVGLGQFFAFYLLRGVALDDFREGTTWVVGLVSLLVLLLSAQRESYLRRAAAVALQMQGGLLLLYAVLWGMDDFYRYDLFVCQLTMFAVVFGALGRVDFLPPAVGIWMTKAFLSNDCCDFVKVLSAPVVRGVQLVPWGGDVAFHCALFVMGCLFAGTVRFWGGLLLRLPLERRQ